MDTWACSVSVMTQLLNLASLAPRPELGAAEPAEDSQEGPGSRPQKKALHFQNKEATCRGSCGEWGCSPGIVVERASLDTFLDISETEMARGSPAGQGRGTPNLDFLPLPKGQRCVSSSLPALPGVGGPWAGPPGWWVLPMNHTIKFHESGQC